MEDTAATCSRHSMLDASVGPLPLLSVARVLSERNIVQYKSLFSIDRSRTSALSPRQASLLCSVALHQSRPTSG